MKYIRGLIIAGCIAGSLLLHAEGPLPPQTHNRADSYTSADQVISMPRRTGIVEKKSPCSAHFRSSDGKAFSIGSPGATAEIIHFIGTLQKGHEYTFPDEFLAYQRRQKASQ